MGRDKSKQAPTPTEGEKYLAAHKAAMSPEGVAAQHRAAENPEHSTLAAEGPLIHFDQRVLNIGARHIAPEHLKTAARELADHIVKHPPTDADRLNPDGYANQFFETYAKQIMPAHAKGAATQQPDTPKADPFGWVKPKRSEVARRAEKFSWKR